MQTSPSIYPHRHAAAMAGSRLSSFFPDEQLASLARSLVNPSLVLLVNPALLALLCFTLQILLTYYFLFFSFSLTYIIDIIYI